MTVRNLFLSHFSFTAEYDQVEFSHNYPPLAFRIDNKGTGIDRAAWSTGDEAQYQTNAFTITTGASEQ